jgi:hypothetical protein
VLAAVLIARVDVCSVSACPHLQPALLYLVPACLGAALLTGAVRGELALLLKFQEAGGSDDKAAAATTVGDAGKGAKAE